MSAGKFLPVTFVVGLFAILALATACTPSAGIAAQYSAPTPGNDNQTFSSPLAFESTLEVTEFIVQDEKLVAAGEFTVVDFEGNVETQMVMLPVNDMIADPACTVLTVSLGPLNLDVLGMTINAQTLQFVTLANPDKGFTPVMLCGIVETFKSADVNLVAQLLNELLALFG
jgi:hypothetical protein